MWTGLVLAGGRGRRMGQDKALLRLDDRTLLERAIDLVRAAGGEPVVVGPGRPELPLPGVRRLDETATGAPAAGPLPALRHGLRATGAPLVVALACDLPFLTPALLERLVREAERFDAVVPRAGGELQVLAAAYRRACLPAIEAACAAGEAALHAILPRVRTRILEEAELQDCGGAALFLNINTPGDLERAAALLAARRP
jgi:molybdopterin-guanine dinucleotide biosynthesis protein A